jgi:multidrug efflux system membrane fusion protein
LKYIKPGMKAELYVMSKPNQPFSGTVDSITFGVTPQETTPGGALPNVERTLAWVHLASRFPVRVRVDKPQPTLFRIGESGYIIIRGGQGSSEP